MRNCLPIILMLLFYSNLWLELFFDLYIICLLLSLIPLKVRRWIRALLYVIAYATSITDLFCWVKFQSTLNPSMLLLVGETDGREAGEFFSSYMTTDILFSSVGLLLLIMLLQILVVVGQKIKLPIAVSDKMDVIVSSICSAATCLRGVFALYCSVGRHTRQRIIRKRWLRCSP